MLVVGTFETCRLRRQMSEFEVQSGKRILVLRHGRPAGCCDAAVRRRREDRPDSAAGHRRTLPRREARGSTAVPRPASRRPSSRSTLPSVPAGPLRSTPSPKRSTSPTTSCVKIWTFCERRAATARLGVRRWHPGGRTIRAAYRNSSRIWHVFSPRQSRAFSATWSR
jgi:hypothetical protein